MITINPYVFPGIRRSDLPEEYAVLGDPAQVSQKMILDSLQDVLNVNFKQLCSPIRRTHHVRGRIFYCHLMRKYTGWSLKEIGQSINRDHTTVIHNIRNHEAFVETEDKFKELDATIERDIAYRRTLVVYKLLTLLHEKDNSQVLEMSELS